MKSTKSIRIAFRNAVVLFASFKTVSFNNFRWEYIEKLHEYQDNHGLRAANKLTSQHVHYQNKKMKVSLVVQTIASESVAKTLR